jgi:hypothetical protein
MKTKLRNSIYGLLPIAVTLVCFGLLPNAQAVDPPPDGGYPGGNTAEGTDALFTLTTGVSNTGLGFKALYHDTTDDGNTATGREALFSNTTGDANTATGRQALFSNTTGGSNTANGFNALNRNTTGAFNTATGGNVLSHNADGNTNTANGFSALLTNTTGDGNTANGFNALASNSTGNSNTATGLQALFRNADGVGNTAIGVNALYNTTGSSNTAIGVAAGDLLTGNGNVCIGRGVHGVAGENNTTRIRNISDTVQPVVGIDPDYVTVDSNGRLGRANVSSRRYKHGIKPMDKASEALYALKPVSFRYNRQYDATQTLAFGLIAEEVAEVYPDLVGRKAEGQSESVRYEQINAMLLNEFLKEHRKMQELEANAVRQQKQIEALTAGL